MDIPEVGIDEVQREVVALAGAMFPAHDCARILLVFGLVFTAFDGRLQGYQKLQTPYHDARHTLEVVQCAARLLHGLHLAGKPVDDEVFDMAVIAALLHDSGYLKRYDEGEGSGAQFTSFHVLRSVEFAKAHLDYPADFMAGVVKAILMTDHQRSTLALGFASDREELAARVTATADLVSQTASREYLERLLFLYFEFREAGYANYEDFHDLLEKTTSYYAFIRKRLTETLGNLSTYLALHFEKQEGSPQNHYQESIDRNLAYLERVVARDKGERLDMLKRGGIVARAIEQISGQAASEPATYQ